MKEKKLIKLKKFLKGVFKKRIQAFTTKNIVGDYMETIYNKDGIQVDYAPGYGYIEIFGLTDEEYEDLIDNTGYLKTFNVDERSDT